METEESLAFEKKGLFGEPVKAEMEIDSDGAAAYINVSNASVGWRGGLTRKTKGAVSEAIKHLQKKRVLYFGADNEGNFFLTDQRGEPFQIYLSFEGDDSQERYEKAFEKSTTRSHRKWSKWAISENVFMRPLARKRLPILESFQYAEV